VIATAPGNADGTMRECTELGIKDVWMHRSYGQGSLSGTAADFGHKVMRVTYRVHVAKTV